MPPSRAALKSIVAMTTGSILIALLIWLAFLGRNAGFAGPQHQRRQVVIASTQRSACQVQIVDTKIRQLDCDFVNAVTQRFCRSQYAPGTWDLKDLRFEIREVGDRLAGRRIDQAQMHAGGVTGGEIALLGEKFKTVWFRRSRSQSWIPLRREGEAMGEGR